MVTWVGLCIVGTFRKQRWGWNYYASANLCILMNRKNKLAFTGLSLLLKCMSGIVLSNSLKYCSVEYIRY